MGSIRICYGSVATLVAARRNDVHNLVTVAGVLDHELWTRNHYLSPLTGSLNADDAWPSLTDIAQIHYVGSADEIIDESLAESFLNRCHPRHQPETIGLQRQRLPRSSAGQLLGK